MRLLLVRHGESICGVNGIVGGTLGCTGLTDRGFEQARALRDRFERTGEVKADLVMSSTLPRAYQTACEVAPLFGLDVVRDVDLVEMIPGEIDGRSWDDWRNEYAFDVPGEPDRPLSPGGDSLNSFQARVKSTLERFAADHAGQTVLAFCHGGVVGNSLSAILGVPGTDFAGSQVDFTSITEWEWTERWKLVRFNDVAHLAGTGLLDRVSV